MVDFLSQEPFRSLLTAGFGGGLLILLAKVIERMVPSRDLMMTSEQAFRQTLLERISKLEEDRDRVAIETQSHIAQYWDLQNRYEALVRKYDQLEIEVEQIRQSNNPEKGAQ